MLIGKLPCQPFAGAVIDLKVFGVPQLHSSCFCGLQSISCPGADLLPFLLIQQCVDAQLEVVGSRHRSNFELDAVVLHQGENECGIPTQPGKFCHQEDAVGAAAEIHCLLQNWTISQFLASGLHLHQFLEDGCFWMLLKEEINVPSLGFNTKTIGTLFLG